MRILHLIPYMHPSAGGPPVVVDRWCVELQKLGCDVHVLTTDGYADGDSDEWIQEYQARYPMTVLPKRGPKGFGYSRQMRAEFQRLLAETDLVHVHNLWGYTNLLAAKFCPPANVPCLVSTHGMLDPNSVGRKRLKKQVYGNLLEFPALRKTTGLVFTHPEEERLAREQCAGLPAGHVVPLGTEEPPDKTPEELTEHFLTLFPQCRDRRRIVFLSRLHSKKGLDLLIPAIKRVVAQQPDAQLLLVGPGEPDYVAWLKGLCEEHGVADHTLFVGSLAGVDKWAALAAGDVYALPSYQENFAIALVEALRVGSPVICSQRVNLWSDLQQADAATVCDLNPESVAECILSLLNNPQTARQQAANGSRYAEEHFTWPRSATNLLRCYESVLTQLSAS